LASCPLHNHSKQQHRRSKNNVVVVGTYWFIVFFFFRKKSKKFAFLLCFENQRETDPQNTGVARELGEEEKKGRKKDRKKGSPIK
jgi:hypothetical protein